MSRLIDADALHKAYMELRNFKQDPQSGDWISLRAVPLTTVIRMLNEAPSIDIEPKRGEWKPFDLTWGRSIWYCTACEESTEVPCDIWEHKPIYKYCPNCGADMRGEDNE